MTEQTNNTIDQAALIQQLQEQLAALQANQPQPQTTQEKILNGAKDQATKNLDTFCSSVAQGAGWGIALALTLF